MQCVEGGNHFTKYESADRNGDRGGTALFLDHETEEKYRCDPGGLLDQL